MTPGSGAFPILVVLAMVAGASLTFQALVNAQLRGLLGSPLRASFVSYIVGTLACAVVLLVRRESFAVFDGRIASANALYWTGGVYGLAYLAITIWLLPRIPTTQLFSFIVAGQLLAALVFERIGLFGTVRGPIDASKLIGIAFMVLAVYLIRR